MWRRCLLWAGLLIGGSAFANEAVEPSPWTLEGDGVDVLWPVDIGLVGIGTTTWVLTGGLPAANPTGRSEPRGLDGLQPHWNPGALIPSDVLGHPFHFHREFGYLNLPLLTIATTSVAGGLVSKDVEVAAVDFVLMAEAMALSAGASSVLKAVISRPRPFTSEAFESAYPEVYTSHEVQAYFGEEEDFEAYKSFPSGHTSSAGAIYFSAATLIGLHANDGKIGGPVFYLAQGVALGLTVTTGILRVHYGVHHPTDVIAGGLLGGAIGVGVPLLHLRR